MQSFAGNEPGFEDVLAQGYDDMFRVEAEGMRTDTNQNMSAMYTYTDDLLTAIRTTTTDYTFTYGNFGLRSSVKADMVNLATYTYNGYKELRKLDYGNGDSIQYTYDNQGRLLTETYEDGDIISYEYDNSGNLSAVTGSGITSTFRYDLTDRLVKYTQSGNNRTYSAGYVYNDKGLLSQLKETFDTVSRTTEYSYDIHDRPSAVQVGETSKQYSYDFMARAYRATVKNGDSTVLTEQHTFVAPGTGRTSGQIATKRNQAASYDVTYSYTYDGNGNILTISDGTNTTSYEYDSANQLIRENNEAGNYTYTWTYDAGGNIKSRNEYAYTTGELGTPTDTVSYLYQSQTWRALLTSYDGRSITYDGIGNMLSDGLRTYTWEHGRQLACVEVGNTEWYNLYDENGIRTERTRGTVSYKYSYEGGKLKYMSVGANKLYFTYDFAGAPLSVNYNGTEYYYVTNLQGDVVAILNAAGTAVVTYTYDAWGNPLTQTGPLSATLGTRNPLRYRGYVYDTDTGLYYLLTRYYDPQLGRFINADGFVSTGQGLVGNNMFAYCLNNPVNMHDSTGHIGKWLKSAWNWIDENLVQPLKNFINDYRNDDESFSLYDNHRHSPDSVFHEQLFSVEVSGPSFSPKEGEVTLGEISVTVINGAWETEHLDLSLLDIGKAQISAGYQNRNLNISAMASAWAPSVTIKAWDVSITISGHIGSIGGVIDVGAGKFNVGAAYGWGASIAVDW